MMRKKTNSIYKTFATASLFSMFFALSSKNAYAGDCGQYVFPNPRIGLYIECAVPDLFGIVQIIIVAAALVLTIFLIFKTVKAFGDSNSQAIQEVPQKWTYLLLLGLVAIGAGGTAINIVLKFLGFETGFNFFLDFFNDLIEWLKTNDPLS